MPTDEEKWYTNPRLEMAPEDYAPIRDPYEDYDDYDGDVDDDDCDCEPPISNSELL